MSADLFTPVRLGALELPNRVLLAPLTRCRAGEGNVPTELMATYYAQRASAGLLISEATQVTPEGQGYPNTPGIHSDAQVEGWRRVTDAVHKAGGRIVMQLWHVGRISHNAYQPNGAVPVAPSAVGLTQGGEARLPDGSKAPYPTPRALETDEIPSVVEAYRRGAANAKAAGFDGVEIHGANGYLIEQFLLSSSNRREDRYGGSVENRARFLFEVVEAVTGAWGGGERVGLRLSPRGADADRQDPDRAGLYGYVAERLNDHGLAFLHLVDPVAGHRMAGPDELVGVNPVPAIRERFRGPIVVNGGYDRASGDAAIAAGYAAVAYGIPFLANPDLPERLRVGAPLNAPDAPTFYGGGAEGYTDYPTLAEGGAVK